MSDTKDPARREVSSSRYLADTPAIERATAVSFLRFYNEHHGSRYRVIRARASRISCEDENTLSAMNLKICVLEQIPDEVPDRASARLTPTGRSGLITGDTVRPIIERLRSEMDKLPHIDTALLVRQFSPTWTAIEWARLASLIHWPRIGFRDEIFDRGIWALCIKAESVQPPGGLFEDPEDFTRIDPYWPHTTHSPKPPFQHH